MRGILVSAGFSLLLVSAMGSTGCHRKQPLATTTPITAMTPTIQELWKAAADKVEEDRNEPEGIRADVEVPEQLKRYSNPHMFLATQAAEARRGGFTLPADYCDLAGLASGGQLVELPMVTADYILFGIGGMATDGPITFYDRERAVSVPLFANDDAYKAWLSAAQGQINTLDGSISLARAEMKRLRHRDRARLADLRSSVSRDSAGLARLSSETQQAALYYGDPVKSFDLFERYQALDKIAANFGGKTYDLNNPGSRLEFKDRLLCYVRPAARDVINELASSYNRQFNRPLPITSLIRTEEYQHDLAAKNPNAARNRTPPHTTGLAFDVYYHYMGASEQQFLMDEIAKLKDAGRVEALKETRDHFHVFAYGEGTRPSDEMIAQSLGELESARSVFNRPASPGRRRYNTRAASATRLRHRGL